MLPLLLATALAITHVTVIDTKGGTSRAGMTVVVRDGRIESVGTAPPPKNAALVDGRGKFLIPGLWDMHVHLSWTRPSALPVLLANGVTGVRDLGSDLRELDGWRAKIDAGALAGPRILRVGPILNGKSFNKYQMVPGSPEATRGAARALAFIGVDFLKVHRRMERESYFALLDEAKKLGIAVVGHIPMTVTPEEASDAGQSVIEHVATIFEGTFSAALNGRKLAEAVKQWRGEQADALFARFVRNHTAFDPTLAAYRPQEGEDAHSRYVARSMREEWGKQPKPTAAELAGEKEMFAEFEEVVRAANRAGVVIVTGTDIAASRIPGFTMHDELAALVESGLTPLQSLQAATINPAMVMNRAADFGSVERGKIADLVLLDADPTADIHNSNRIAAVIANGKLFRRADLDALLRDAEAQAAKN